MSELGKYREAEELAVRALKIMSEQYGENHEATASAKETLANILSDQGKGDEAEKQYQEVLEIRKGL